jgi:hypothetical protein
MGLLLQLLSMVSLSHTVYRFENYVELWYQIPVRDMVSEEAFMSSPTVFVSYEYKLDVRAEAMADEALKQGTHHLLKSSRRIIS